MAKNQQEQEKLLALKKKQEQKQILDQQEIQAKMKLEKKYMAFLDMTSQQMEAELKKKGAVKKVEVTSDDLDLIVADYNKKYGKESWYKEPEIKDGKTSLEFPSQSDLSSFCQEQADKKRAFLVIDVKTNQVLAYSNGNGTLYNGDGSVYKGGEFQGSDKTVDDFQMPEREGLGMKLQ